MDKNMEQLTDKELRIIDEYKKAFKEKFNVECKLSDQIILDIYYSYYNDNYDTEILTNMKLITDKINK